MSNGTLEPSPRHVDVDVDVDRMVDSRWLYDMQSPGQPKIKGRIRMLTMIVEVMGVLDRADTHSYGPDVHFPCCTWYTTTQLAHY